MHRTLQGTAWAQRCDLLQSKVDRLIHLQRHLDEKEARLEAQLLAAYVPDSGGAQLSNGAS